MYKKPADRNMLTRDLKCLRCGATDLEATDRIIRCRKCRQVYRADGDVGNFLYNPENYVIQELCGMMREDEFPAGDMNDFLVRETDHLESIDDLMAKSREKKETLNYFESTKVNFDAVFSTLPLTGNENVLEIGCGSNSYFLGKFSERGCACTGVDLCFKIEKAATSFPYRRILADMNRTPFRDESFDVVLASATAHHSPVVERVLAEMSRLVKKGGLLLVMNEPVKGILKGMAKPSNPCERDEMINENEYTLSQYTTPLKRRGCVIQLIFPEYVDRKLQSGAVGGFRFGWIGRIISVFWKNSCLKKILKKTMLYPGLLLLGIPLVMVARKTG